MTPELPPPPDSGDDVPDTPKLRFKRNMKKFGQALAKGIHSEEFQKFAKGMQKMNDGFARMPEKNQMQPPPQQEAAPVIKPVHENVEIRSSHIFDLPRGDEMESNLDAALWGKSRKWKRR